MEEPAKPGEPPPYGEVTNLLRLKLDRIPATRTPVGHRQMSVGPADHSLSQSINRPIAARRAPDDSEKVKHENANLKAELRRLQMDVIRAADTIQRLSNPEVADTRTAIGARFKPSCNF